MNVATSGGQVSQFISRELTADQATTVVCDQIASDFGIISIHGIERPATVARVDRCQ